MKVADNQLRLESVKLAEIVDRPLERVARLRRIEIADVLTQPDLAAESYGHRTLQMATDRQHRLQVVGHSYRKWRIASGAAHDVRTIRHTNDRIVARASDGPVVQNEDIGDLLQAGKGVVVVDDNRLAGEVPARGHQWKRIVRHEQMVYR